MKLIEQMTFAKDTNARIEKRREDSNVATLGKKSSKTLYQKDKENRRMEKTPQNGKAKTAWSSKCPYCGRSRHPCEKNGDWRVNCPAQKAICLDCKQTGHFAKTPKCYAKKVGCVKIRSVNSARSTNIVEIKAIGPEKSH